MSNELELGQAIFRPLDEDGEIEIGYKGKDWDHYYEEIYINKNQAKQLIKWLQEQVR